MTNQPGLTDLEYLQAENEQLRVVNAWLTEQRQMLLARQWVVLCGDGARRHRDTEELENDPDEVVRWADELRPLCATPGGHYAVPAPVKDAIRVPRRIVAAQAAIGPEPLLWRRIARLGRCSFDGWARWPKGQA
jgi:hypothetical protein